MVKHSALAAAILLAAAHPTAVNAQSLSKALGIFDEQVHLDKSQPLTEHRHLPGEAFSARTLRTREEAKSSRLVKSRSMVRLKEPVRAHDGSRAVQPLVVPVRPGSAVTVDLPAVEGPTLFNGDYAHRVDVPSGATRLDFQIATQTRGVDVDLVVRYGAEPVVQGGELVADYAAWGPTGDESITIDGKSEPSLRSGAYYVAFIVWTPNRDVRMTLTTNVTGGGSGSGSPGGCGYNSLPWNGQATVPLPAVDGATLFNGEAGYCVNVPNNVSSLELKLASRPSEADVDLFVRFDRDAELSDDGIAADWWATGPDGNETLVIRPDGQQYLRPGKYFIAFVVWTRGVNIQATLSARGGDGGGGTGGGQSSGRVLTSGNPASFELPSADSPTLFHGDFSFRIDVPANATRLVIELDTPAAGGNVDLFVRRGADVQLNLGSVVADYGSHSPSGQERLVITRDSGPALQAGTYYIAFAQFTPGRVARGTVKATIETGGGNANPDPAAGSRDLRSGVPVRFTLPAVGAPTLFYGGDSYRINVPQGAERLEVRITSPTQGSDVDLYLRHGADVTISGENLLADHGSEGPDSSEVIVVTPSSSPRLRPETYYLGFGLWTLNRDVEVIVTATVR